MTDSYNKNTYVYSEKTSINRELRANLLYLAKVRMDKAIEELGSKLTEDKKMNLANKVKSLVEDEILQYEGKHILTEKLKKYNKELTAVITGTSQTCDFIKKIKTLEKTIAACPYTVNSQIFMYPGNVSSFNAGNASSNIDGTNVEKYIYANISTVNPTEYSSKIGRAHV